MRWNDLASYVCAALLVALALPNAALSQGGGGVTGVGPRPPEQPTSGNLPSTREQAISVPPRRVTI